MTNTYSEERLDCGVHGYDRHSQLHRLANQSGQTRGNVMLAICFEEHSYSLKSILSLSLFSFF